MIKRIIKFLAKILLTYVLICFITPFNNYLRNRSIENQINYQWNILDRGFDDELQERFPEGKLFSNCLLALSTIEYCNKKKITNRKYALIIDNCIRRIQSDKAKNVFDSNLPLKYGAFYQGWSNLLYVNYMNCNLFKFSQLRINISSHYNNFLKNINEIQSNKITILESYFQNNWPADNLITICAINNPKLRTNWISYLLNNTEHHMGLINHSGNNNYLVRGSSTSLITYCLSYCNYSKAVTYNNNFKKLFIDSYLGIQLVKENQDGSNDMDVDSGPVVFGYGASATIMNIKTQANLKNNFSAKMTWGALNLISLPINFFNKKFLILKKEPMLDLFMLWSCTEF